MRRHPEPPAGTSATPFASVGPRVVFGPGVLLLFRVRRRRLRELFAPVVFPFVAVSSCSMKVILPDSSELELPDGATGLDAAAAIGSRLAQDAVLDPLERAVSRTSAFRSRTGSRSRS